MLIAPQPAPGAMWLLDGNNLMHRYFHAAPVEMQDGRQVQAVRGLARLIQRIRAQYEPERIGVVFDDSRESYSGRRDLLPTYKITRTAIARDLSTQIELAYEWLPAKQYSCDTIRVEGFEADDVITTLALSTRTAGYSVYLVTSDKDMHALISDDHPRVAVYNRATGKGAEGWRLYEEADVLARFGVRPNRLLDMLALAGDAADNIPRVPGVGAKTAADLITQYGSLEVLLGVISTVKRDALRRALREHAAAIRLARRVLEPVSVPPDLIVKSIRHAAIKTSPTRSASAPPRP